MAVAAVRRDDVVVVGQMHADAGGDGLLSRVQVREARDRAGGDLDVQTLLELADGLHRAVGLEELRFLKCHLEYRG